MLDRLVRIAQAHGFKAHIEGARVCVLIDTFDGTIVGVEKFYASNVSQLRDVLGY